MQRAFIIVGLLLVALGLVWPWLQKLGLGHLPGDILIERENFRFYLPVTAMILVSVLVSLLLWFLRR